MKNGLGILISAERYSCETREEYKNRMRVVNLKQRGRYVPQEYLNAAEVTYKKIVAHLTAQENPQNEHTITV